MAINFPSSPSNGDEFIDAGSGTEWVYNSADKSWTMTGAGSSSPFNFRGGYDFRTNNTISDLESGDLFIHEGADGTVGSGYVGLSGQITSGTLVLWDGDEFIKLSSSVPGYPDIDDPNYQNGTLDSRYLCLAADAGAQVVQSNDPTEFKGGVQVTGGSLDTVPTGLYTAQDEVTLNNNGNRLHLQEPGQTTFGASFNGEITKDSNANYGINSAFTFDSTTTTCSGFASRPDLENCITTTWSDFRTEIRPTAAVPTNIARSFNYFVDSNVDYGATLNAAFYSALRPGTGDKNFAFYATNATPSYLSGNTYIGGTTARNTLELWKSTLTEEQLEQLEAGTLVAPANVSTPGDGEFARQWYYDQQDAETQAELDAGTLEYPEHLLAANFTDTFALGDNTAINLLSSGNIKCLAVEATQVSASLVRTQNFDSLDRDNLSSFGFNPSPAGPTINFQAKPWGVTDENTLCSGIGVAMYQSTSSTVRGDVANFYAFPAEDIALTKSDGIYSGFYGLIDKSINGGEAAACFTAENVSVSDGSSTGTNAGFYSKLITANPNNYNFYAAGNAPNYLAGEARFGSRFRVFADPDGTDKGAFSIVATEGSSANGGFTLKLEANTAAKNYHQQIVSYGTEGNINGTGLEFRAGADSGSSGQRGSILFNNSGGISVAETSDYRTKSNVNSLESTVDTIKSLNPVRYDRGLGINVPGFIAHELQEHVPNAVVGTKDAEEAIGTLADYDGTVLETAVVEPGDLTYTEDVEVDGVTTQEVRTRTWTATGTQPVYQGVDQTKLIPLLTKALQEALERIEALEAAATA